MGDSSLSARPPRRPGRLLWVAVAAPPLALAIATVTGVALLRGGPTSLALAGALALVGLPALGVAAGLGGRPGAIALAAWGWSFVLLAGLPLYFPGERAAATREGVSQLAGPLGDDGASALAEWSAGLVATLGEDPAPLPVAPGYAEQPLPVWPEELEDEVEGALVRLETPPGPRPTEPKSRSTRIAYEGDGRSMKIDVAIDGPSFGEELKLIFDTGATFTTLDREALRRIGVPVPRDAPRVTLRTANGTVEAPLVLVDAVWMGDEVVEWVTVAVCEPCAGGGTSGLLGLNVSSQFGVAIDHDRKSIDLRPRRGRPNRRLDITQWLRAESTATRFGDGRIQVAIEAHNRSEREVSAAIFEVECVDQSFAVQLDDIRAHASVDTVVSLPRGTECSRYGVQLRNANWLLDRF